MNDSGFCKDINDQSRQTFGKTVDEPERGIMNRSFREKIPAEKNGTF